MATETLVCERCEQTWERDRVRGRKPKHCPACKSKPVGVITKEMTKTEEGKEVIVKSRPVDEVTFPEGIKPIRNFVGAEEYEGIIIDGLYLCRGMRTHIIGEDGTYTFMSAVNRRNNGGVYIWLMGETGDYQGKHRAVHADRIDR